MNNNLNHIKNTIFVSSGKGGVGKSTIAANLAVSLAKQGFQTGLLDTDFFGPSMPTLFGLDHALVEIFYDGKNELFVPILKNGVKVISPGFMIKTKEGETGRIPAVTETISQIILKTLWKDLDYLIIDMPACTGDLAVTIVNAFPDGQAIIVTTPQQLSVNGSQKAANMFLKPEMDIRILGVVENMSYFTPNNHPKEKYLLFGQGGGQKLADEIDVPLLAKVPFGCELGNLNNAGQSVFLSSNQRMKESFRLLAEKINLILINS